MAPKLDPALRPEPMPRDERGWKVAPAPDGRGKPTEQGRRSPMMGRRFIIFVAILLAVNWISVLAFSPSGPSVVRIPYSPTFLAQVQIGNVREIAATGSTIQGTFRSKVTFPQGRPASEATTSFSTEVPTFADSRQLSSLLQAKGVQVNARSLSQSRSLLTSLLLGFGPTLLLVGLFVLIARRAAGAAAGGPLGAFGRSKARRADPEQSHVMFADVAGIEEAKAELFEVVDFLRSPERYQRLGGRIPHGVLLSGAPGTGKTLLARAVAGEAHAAFFSISASEFVEAIVGVGASRARDLFKQAKEAAPSIIFIDELDAIGRSRSSGLQIGGNDEREQTLNQILTEMDGFETSESVVVLGATNRPEVLDAALLRPGRFDRRISVEAPDKDGRRQILEVHTRTLPLADDVDLERLAATTPGMVGADLANLANEAALLAAREDHERVRMADFTGSLEKILLGAPRGLVLTQPDRERTAYHEAGHALVGMLTPRADPVRKVSIIPRGMALGVTLSSPDADRVSYQKEDLEARIRVALGGRVAEELVYATITTGAQSDIASLTQIARQMVTTWGMSPTIGPIAVPSSDDHGFGGLSASSPISEQTRRQVEEEVWRIVDAAHSDVTELLSEHREQLEALTAALIKAETLDELDAYAAAEIDRVPSPSKPESVALKALGSGASVPPAEEATRPGANLPPGQATPA